MSVSGLSVCVPLPISPCSVGILWFLAPSAHFSTASLQAATAHLSSFTGGMDAPFGSIWGSPCLDAPGPQRLSASGLLAYCCFQRTTTATLIHYHRHHQQSWRQRNGFGQSHAAQPYNATRDILDERRRHTLNQTLFYTIIIVLLCWTPLYPPNSSWNYMCAPLLIFLVLLTTSWNYSQAREWRASQEGAPLVWSCLFWDSSQQVPSTLLYAYVPQ
mgnify:CR=1 FL=1